MRVSGILLAMCASLWSFSPTSYAEIVLSVDMDLAQLGVQATNTSTVRIGESFTAGLVLNMTSPSNLGSYRFSVAFDPAVLQYTGRTESAFGALTPSQASRTFNNTTGFAFRFESESTAGPGQVQPLGPLQIGTVTFTVTGAAQSLIRVGPFDQNFDLFVSASPVVNVTPSVSFVGGTLVTAVPEPASLTMVGLAVFGLAFGRRRMLYRFIEKRSVSMN